VRLTPAAPRLAAPLSLFKYLLSTPDDFEMGTAMICSGDISQSLSNNFKLLKLKSQQIKSSTAHHDFVNGKRVSQYRYRVLAAPRLNKSLAILGSAVAEVGNPNRDV